MSNELKYVLSYYLSLSLKSMYFCFPCFSSHFLISDVVNIFIINNKMAVVADTETMKVYLIRHAESMNNIIMEGNPENY